MKSINEKAEEYSKNWYHRNGFFLENKCRGCYAHVLSSYEAGANYVLGEILDKTSKCITVKDAYETFLKCVEQLKK